MQWVGANKQREITRTKDDPILKRHVLQLGHNNALKKCTTTIDIYVYGVGVICLNSVYVNYAWYWNFSDREYICTLPRYCIATISLSSNVI